MEDKISREPRDLGRALCIITGASKGFGRTLALQLSCLLKPRSVLMLVARTTEQLNQLKEDIITLYGGQNQLDVCCVQADLEKKEGVEKTVQAAKETSVSEMDHLLLINNAGPLDTDMQLQARLSSGDLQLRRSFSLMFSEGQLLSCEESGAKLMKLLLDNDYQSGAHLDFYEL
ncbi:sepiapterin reductase-like [Sinocyclocheilus grahami]|uniref:sepiapterin reductase-like n=1 Tax=Sinocyclocheilus grahami TaxID=75366 RepID=UPI0007AD1C8B|nr:PREDICTED: sepiapterin reductase-like [Sinocyclocheilus grahami]